MERRQREQKKQQEDTNPNEKTAAKKRGGSQTSSFGTPTRESHDSSVFYASNLYSGTTKKSVPGRAQRLPEELANTLHCHDATDLSFIPDNSVHLMVTSPPYNVGKDYDSDMALQEYLAMLKKVFAEVYRVLVPGGRAVVNVANLGRRPYLPLSHMVTHLMVDIGYLMRGEIIWNKSASAGTSCAWGSFKSASNPTLRDVHEYLLVFCKGEYKLPRSKEEKLTGRKDTMLNDDFVAWTKSIWDFKTESARRIGHPAPFPVELPRRCIEMYSFFGDVVLDPFVGSGTTAVAAVQCSRRYIGVDISTAYIELANIRVTKVLLSVTALFGK
jgi:modification methylase